MRNLICGITLAVLFIFVAALVGVSLAADLRGSYDLGNGYTALLGICVTSPCYDNELIVRDAAGAYILMGWHYAEVPCFTSPCQQIISVWDPYGTYVGDFEVITGAIRPVMRSTQ